MTECPQCGTMNEDDVKNCKGSVDWLRKTIQKFGFKGAGKKVSTTAE